MYVCMSAYVSMSVCVCVCLCVCVCVQEFHIVTNYKTRFIKITPFDFGCIYVCMLAYMCVCVYVCVCVCVYIYIYIYIYYMIVG
jgi:hypothetical protein